MSQELTVEVSLSDGSRVEVAVAWKRVKNLNLRIRRDGTLAASVPARTSRERVEAFLKRHVPWIEGQLARRERRRAAEAAAPGMVPLWGRLVDAREAGAEDEDGLRALYRREVSAALPALATSLERRTGLAATGWSVRDMRTRWGSCTPATGRIRINLRLAAYPPRCLEAVVAHELTHLAEAGHNARFHTLLDAWCPGNREATALLRRPALEVAEGA